MGEVIGIIGAVFSAAVVVGAVVVVYRAVTTHGRVKSQIEDEDKKK